MKLILKENFKITWIISFFIFIWIFGQTDTKADIELKSGDHNQNFSEINKLLADNLEKLKVTAPILKGEIGEFCSLKRINFFSDNDNRQLIKKMVPRLHNGTFCKGDNKADNKTDNKGEEMTLFEALSSLNGENKEAIFDLGKAKMPNGKCSDKILYKLKGKTKSEFVYVNKYFKISGFQELKNMNFKSLKELNPKESNSKMPLTSECFLNCTISELRFYHQIHQILNEKLPKNSANHYEVVQRLLNPDAEPEDKNDSNHTLCKKIVDPSADKPAKQAYKGEEKYSPFNLNNIDCENENKGVMFNNSDVINPSIIKRIAEKLSSNPSGVGNSSSASTADSGASLATGTSLARPKLKVPDHLSSILTSLITSTTSSPALSTSAQSTSAALLSASTDSTPKDAINPEQLQAEMIDAIAKAKQSECAVMKMIKDDGKSFYKVKTMKEVKGRKFYFSEKMADSDGRDYLVMYTENKWGKWRPRFIYRSMSDGTWRSSPGYDWDGRIKKSYNEEEKDSHYVQQGILSPELTKHLNDHYNTTPTDLKSKSAKNLRDFNKIFRVYSSEELEKMEREKKAKLPASNVDSEARTLYEKEEKEEYEQSKLRSASLQSSSYEDECTKAFEIIKKCTPGSCFQDIEDSPLKQKKKSASIYVADLNKDIKEKEQGVCSEFFPKFSGLPVTIYKTSHTLLSKKVDSDDKKSTSIENDITVEVYESTTVGENPPNKQKIEWHMAHDSSGRAWIDRVRLKDDIPNSFGNDRLVNMGILTNKPLEYKKQASLLENGSERKDFNETYYDITPLLRQIYPISEYYKERILKKPN